MDTEATELSKRLARDIMQEVMLDEELRNCDSFSLLHDYCDANCLAGTCEPGHFIHDHAHEHEILNDAQTRVHFALAALNGERTDV